jgi:fumarylacetoacetase
MIPLGPLNGKSFATSISPWVITLDALEPFKCSAPARNSDVILPKYLRDSDPKPTFDLKLSSSLRADESSVSTNICESSFSSIYWTMRDLVAHQTINGCSLRTGDILATGTISGATKESHGCLLELIAKGGVEVANSKGEKEQRIFLKDGDTISISAFAGRGVGFGECVGTILPPDDD